MKIKEFSYNGHTEKAELIKFSQINCGDILWFKCSYCKSFHRTMVLKFSKNHPSEDYSHNFSYQDLWICADKYPHREVTDNTLAIDKSIEQVYRVINIIEDIHNKITEELIKQSN